MKTLLVFALAVAVAVAEEKKAEIKPLVYTTSPFAYNALPYAYNSLAYSAALPYTYNTLPLTTYAAPAIQPVQTKFVPKEYEVEVKSFEFEPVGSDCKNMFGNPVPCKDKRSADEEEEKKVETEIKPLALTYAAPWAYNTLPYAYNTLPVAYNSLAYSTALPYAWNTLPYASRIFKRSAEEEEKKAEIKPLVYTTSPFAYNALPYAYNNLAYSTALPYAYNTLPLTTYAAPAPVKVEAIKPIVQEVEVPTPVLKKVVEKIPVGPACQNAFGWPVACA